MSDGEDKPSWDPLAIRAIIAICMESPFYFSLPLAERLRLVKQQHETIPWKLGFLGKTDDHPPFYRRR